LIYKFLYSIKKSKPLNNNLSLIKNKEEIMDSLLLAALLGGVGGLTRGVVGLLKAISLRRKILWNYYGITVIIAIIIGIFVGIIFDFDPRLSLLAGYAGTDILEGIYKSFATQKVYVNPKSKS
jgi:hypothetical protein